MQLLSLNNNYLSHQFLSDIRFIYVFKAQNTMKKFLFTIAALLFLTACAKEQKSSPTDEGNEVFFEIARNYFFHNDQDIPASPKITKAEDFGQLFGMATFAGEEGKPTAIDFAKQFVLVIILPVTDIDTEIIPAKVVKKDDSLFYTYKIKTGEKQSFSSQPLSIITLDKRYEDKEVILLKE